METPGGPVKASQGLAPPTHAALLHLTYPQQSLIQSFEKCLLNK